MSEENKYPLLNKEDRELFISIVSRYLHTDPSLGILLHDIRKSLMNQGAKLWDEHNNVVAGIAKWMNPHTYVEIGANHGGTFNKVAPLVKRAVAVERKEKLHKDIVSADNVEKYAMSSDEFAKKWKDEINLLFIDADHSHSQSLKDFLHFSQFVPEDGLILMHDTYPPNQMWIENNRCCGVYKTAWFIRNELRDSFEIVTLPFECGISIIRRAKKPLHWKGKPTYGPLTPSCTLLLAGLFLKGTLSKSIQLFKKVIQRLTRKTGA